MITHAPYRGGIVNDPRWWGAAAGYEFWAVFGHVDLVTVMAATNDGLSGYGWSGAIAANASVTEGSTGDFLSSADVDPTRLVVGSTNTNIWSPRIFGSYDHGLVASRFLNYMPTKLGMECYARFSVASANENTSFIGFHAVSATDITAAGGLAGIMSDGANFRLKSDTGDDAGAAVDTAWHLFKFIIDGTNVEWFIDGTSQGTITMLNDIFPTSWGVASGTTNRPQVAWVRIWYE